MHRRIFSVLVAAAAVAACGDSTGVDGGASVGVAFTSTSNVVAAGPAASVVEGQPSAITLPGTNGTLVIDAIYVIVSELELEGSVASCEEGLDDDDCEEVEQGPFLVEVPTDGSALRVATAIVPLGSYNALEWEVEDLDFEDDDDQQETAAVISEIETLFGAGVWPSGASMAVVGSFTAEGETTATEFTTFFAAEIEVEMELVPPLELTAEGASRELTIVLSPDLWFLNTDGTVMNLALYSGELVEFEAEFENGVVEIEVDDDSDDDDD